MIDAKTASKKFKDQPRKMAKLRRVFGKWIYPSGREVTVSLMNRMIDKEVKSAIRYRHNYFQVGLDSYDKSYVKNHSWNDRLPLGEFLHRCKKLGYKVTSREETGRPPVCGSDNDYTISF